MLFRTLKLSAGILMGLGLTGLGTVTLSETAHASMCDSRDRVTKLLESRYKEAPIAVGMVSDRGVMEVYVSSGSGTWSIVVTNPQGKTCIIAAGQNFEELEAKLFDPEA
ncbi:MAG: hypothetical protein AAGA88_00100 [Pseudomonadota bacterium]